MSDSPWSLIAGLAKAFNLPIDVVLYDISFANLMLYSATLPSYDFESEKGVEKKKDTITINASDPKNNDKVASILKI